MAPAPNCARAARSMPRVDGPSASAPIDSGLLPNTYIHALATYDDGTGTTLYAGAEAGGLWKFTGTGWVSIGGNRVFSLLVFDDGSGPALYVGGESMTVSRWNGRTFEQVGPPSYVSAHSLARFDEDGQQYLVA